MATDRDKILLVDDERAVLDGLVRQHGRLYAITSACGVEAGLKAIAEEGPFAVVVADFYMPGMNGAEFLAKARDADPSMIRIMLTGQQDLQVALDGVNRGNIFRFMTKPCGVEVFRECVESALDQWRLLNVERDLLEQTLRGSIEVLVNVLALAKPVAFGKATRIRGYVKHIVGVLNLTDAWKYETAALLSQVGCISIPDDLLDSRDSGDELPPEHVAILDRHPEVGKDLLFKIPRLRTVAEIVLRQEDPAPLTEDRTVTVGARILSTALQFDHLLSTGATRKQALEALLKEEGKYGKSVIRALSSAKIPLAGGFAQALSVKELRVGMEIREDVCSDDGTLIVKKGHVVTEGTLQLLHNFASLKRLGKVEFLAKIPQETRDRSRPAHQNKRAA